MALSTPFELHSGIVFNRFQSFQEHATLGRRGRWGQLQLTGTQGVVRILSLSVEAEPTQRALRNAA
jgi:hypothetical protein